MSINIIAMLTNNDRTVDNALKLFMMNKKATTNCWGFKDVGADDKLIHNLANKMKILKKKLFFEPLAENEDDCFRAAENAIKNNFDYLIGMKFIPKINDLLQKHDIKYFPTCGRRSGIPRLLYGTIEEIIQDADKIASFGVNGICLSVYRYADGNPEELVREFKKIIKLPLIISGGINNFERLGMVKRVKPWGFTIGSAFFDHSFGLETTILEKISIMQDFLTDFETEKAQRK